MTVPGGILLAMDSAGGTPDPQAFALRRELRDLIDHLVEGGCGRRRRFEEILQRLGRSRRLALRQMIAILRHHPVGDQVSALEILGRLAHPSDATQLAAIASDSQEPEACRVLCALVVLGLNQGELLAGAEISGLVLRWQARHLAEEPGLREPLLRLYSAAPAAERRRWLALQDDQLDEVEGRAAVFEMLLEAETDPALREMALEALIRLPHPTVRAALRRIHPSGPYERDFVTGALAALAASAEPLAVPEGWQARVGFCDGSSAFPLRFDFRLEGHRPRCALFILDLERGPSEALALVGNEVARYDGLDWDVPGQGASTDQPELYPIEISQALALLEEARRLAAPGRIPACPDFDDACRLLDPLADVMPVTPDALPLPDVPDALQRSSLLVDLPGYAGWFYDGGDRFLDDLRQEHLEGPEPLGPPAAELIDTAIDRLIERGEPARISRRLRHNTVVHRLASQLEFGAIAMAASAACQTREFRHLPLVRRIVTRSLHPGHMFFSPTPDATERSDLAEMLIEDGTPDRHLAFTVDLAWILTRAMEVWLARIPIDDRPSGEQARLAILSLAPPVARWIEGFLDRAEALPATAWEQAGADLRAVLGRHLETCAFPRPAVDPQWHELFALLAGAARVLVFEICLDQCHMHCPAHPRLPAGRALDHGVFPAGRQAEIRIRTWPGILRCEVPVHLRPILSRLLDMARQRQPRPPFLCGICREPRPGTARARSRVEDASGEQQPVCRRCQGRFRRNEALRRQLAERGLTIV